MFSCSELTLQSSSGLSCHTHELNVPPISISDQFIKDATISQNVPSLNPNPLVSDSSTSTPVVD